MNCSIDNMAINCERLLECGRFDHDQALSQWLHEIVLPTLDTLFKKYDQSSEKRHIDHLSLDLGWVDQHNFRDDFITRLSASLDSALNAEMPDKSRIDDRFLALYKAIPLPHVEKPGFDRKTVQKIIHNGFYGKNIVDFFAVMRMLIESHPQSFRTLVMGYAQDVRVRHAIATMFTDDMQESIFRLLEPSHINYIKQILSTAGLFVSTPLANDIDLDRNKKNEGHREGRDAMGEPPNRSEVSKKHQREYLVEYTLAYMVVQRGSQFNRRSYLTYVIKNMASHNNDNFQSVAANLVSQVSASDMANPLKTGLLAALMDIVKSPVHGSSLGDDASSINNTGDVPDVDDGSATHADLDSAFRVANSAKFYFDAFYALFDGVDAVGVDDISRVFFQAGNKCQSLCVLLVDSLRNNRHQLRHIVRALDADASIFLFREIMALRQSLSEGGLERLLVSLIEWREKSADQALFNVYFLEAFLLNLPMDFDAFATRVDADVHRNHDERNDENRDDKRESHNGSGRFFAEPEMGSKNSLDHGYSDIYVFLHTCIVANRGEGVADTYRVDQALRTIIANTTECRAFMTAVLADAAAQKRLRDVSDDALWSLLCTASMPHLLPEYRVFKSLVQQRLLSRRDEVVDSTAVLTSGALTSGTVTAACYHAEQQYFCHALRRNAITFNVGDYLLCLGRELEQLSGLSSSQVLAALAHADLSAHSNTYSNENTQLTNALTTLQAETSRITSDQPDESRVAQSDVWASRIFQLVNRGYWEGDASQWRALLSDNAQLVMSIVIQEGQKYHVRRALSHDVDALIQLDILTLLEPGHAATMMDLADNVQMLSGICRAKEIAASRRSTTNTSTTGDVTLIDVVDHTVSSAPTPVAQLRSQWLEFTFHYVLVDRGSEFNRRSYLRSVLRQMAARDNRNYDELLFSLHSVIFELALPTDYRDDMLAIVGHVSNVGHALNHDQTPSAISQQGDYTLDAHDSINRDGVTESEVDIHNGLWTYEKLMTLVTSSGHINSKQWITVIEGLARRQPYLFQRFIAELKAVDFAWWPLVNRLDAPAVRVILECLMSLTGHINAKQGLELLLSVDSFAKASGDRRLYYGHAIYSLLHDELLNLALIKQKVVAADKARVSEMTPPQTISDVSVATTVSSEKEINTLPPDTTSESTELARRDLLASCEAMLDAPDAQTKIKILCKTYARNDQKFAQLCGLPEPTLSRCLATLAPATYGAVHRYSQYLRNALMGVNLGLSTRELNQRHWQALMTYMQLAPYAFNADRFVQIYLSTVLSAAKKLVSAPSMTTILQAVFERVFVNANIPDRIRETLANVLSAFSYTDLTQAVVITDKRDTVIADGQEHSSKAQAKPNSSKTSSPSQLLYAQSSVNTQSTPARASGTSSSLYSFPLPDEPEEYIGIGVLGAGVVLVAPYIAMLFARLELTHDGVFVSDEHASRAVHLLHYLAFGFSPLCFDELNNKPLFNVICGFHLQQDHTAHIELSDSEKQTCDGLLGSVIGHWSALGNTSVAGLQETFLQREGVLTHIPERGWKLQIEKSVYDVMLDRLPWSYATIRYPFMEEVLHVDWR